MQFRVGLVVVVYIVQEYICQVHEWWTQFFFISFFFFFQFIFLFSIFRTTRVRIDQSYCHISQQSDDIVIRQIMRHRRTQQKVLEQVMLYNMNNTCQPYVLHMVVQGRVHSSEHGLLVVVYKIDYFVKGFLSSSFILLNTKVVLLSNSKSFKS